MSLVDAQLAKMNPGSGAAQLRAQIQQSAAPPAAAAAQPTPIEMELAKQESIGKQQQVSEIEQQRLELEHGKGQTIGSQFARGLLDAALAPGALEGAELETVGKHIGWHGLEQFGQDLGQSANADAALQSVGFLFGGGGKAGITTAERVQKESDDQQKAWPMLSQASHIAGMVVPMLLGGEATAGSRLPGIASKLTSVGFGALEGASGGAQQAYERHEGLREVLSSASLGAFLGGGSAAAGEGLASLISSKPLRAAAREMVEDQNLGAAGIERSAIGKMFGAEAGAAEQTASDLAGELGSYKFQTGPLEGKPLMRMLRTPETIRDGITQATEETSQKLAAARAAILDPAQAADPEAAAAALEQFHASGADASALDDAAEQILASRGADAGEFQALRRQADNFQRLTSLLENAQGSTSSALDALPTMGGVAKLLAGASPIHAAAHTLLMHVGKNLVQQRAASTIATLANKLVIDNVSTALGNIIPAITASTATALGSEGAKALPERAKPEPPLAPEQQQERYQKQLEMITKAVATPDLEHRTSVLERLTGDFGPAMSMAVGADSQMRLMQLQKDIPKPEPNIRGKAYEMLSLQQLKLANSMYEATTKPMSVFSDFAAGVIDYDKVSYAWKQYPELQRASQAGLMDILTAQMTEPQRGKISDGMLTQLDNLLGFDGTLQPSLNTAFAHRVDALAAQQNGGGNQKPSGGGPLELPTSKPTFTERLSGARK